MPEAGLHVPDCIVLARFRSDRSEWGPELNELNVFFPVHPTRLPGTKVLGHLGVAQTL